MAREATIHIAWKEGLYRCEHCMAAFAPPSGRGRPPRFCSDACKQADYRRRKAYYRQFQRPDECVTK